MSKKWCLLIQGGGMRGLWPAGAADVLLENHLYPDAVYGTSAGALIGMNYAAKQIGRTKFLMMQGMNDRDFVDLGSFKEDGTILNFDYLLKDCFNKYPFDNREFENGRIDFYACCTNIQNYTVNYFSNRDEDVYKGIEASCSLVDFRNKPVFIQNEPYMDGGYIERIPFDKPLKEDYDLYVVLLTRHLDFSYNEETGLVKKTELRRVERRFGDYKEFTKNYPNNKFRYNNQLNYLRDLEKQGKVIFIGPDDPIEVSTIERREKVLQPLYENGRDVANKMIPKILEALRQDK